MTTNILKNLFNKKSIFFSLALASTMNVFAYDGYPVPGRLEGVDPLRSADNMTKEVFKSFPKWMNGSSKDGIAAKDSQYYFVEFLGPKAMVNEGVVNEFIYSGELTLKPGATFPASNHNANELYYIVDGKAEWVVDDEKRIVVPDNYIFVRPNAIKGFKNLSKTEDLKVYFIRWVDDNKDLAFLQEEPNFINPDLVKKASTANIEAVPTPMVRMSKDDTENKGRLVGTTSFLHDSQLTKFSTSSHPTWVRGTGKGRLSDENSLYTYTSPLSPWVDGPSFVNPKLFVGIANWKPNVPYPAHNHPASEFYYVVDGKGDYAYNDLDMEIEKGDFMFNYPLDVHGWKAKGDKDIRVLSVWFIEDDPKVMNVNAKFVNHEAAQKRETARHYAMPRPAVREK